MRYEKKLPDHRLANLPMTPYSDDEWDDSLTENPETKEATYNLFKELELI